MRAKIIVTVEVEYDIEPGNYAEATSWQDCLNEDLDTLGVEDLMNMSDSHFTLTGELLGEPDLEEFPAREET